jgi:hypothetical protein
VTVVVLSELAAVPDEPLGCELEQPDTTSARPAAMTVTTAPRCPLRGR